MPLHGSSLHRCDVGIVGLGLLSRNLVIQITRQGYSVAGWDPDGDRINTLRNVSSGLSVITCPTLADFCANLTSPRALLMLLPGGPNVERVLADLAEHLDLGDLVVDGSSYHHTFTPRRRAFFAEQGIHYLPVGIAVAGKNVSYGCSPLHPVLLETCRRIRPIFGSVGTGASGEPCVSYMGQRVEEHLLLVEQGNYNRSHLRPL